MLYLSFSSKYSIVTFVISSLKKDYLEMCCLIFKYFVIFWVPYCCYWLRKGEKSRIISLLKITIICSIGAVVVCLGECTMFTLKDVFGNCWVWHHININELKVFGSVVWISVFFTDLIRICSSSCRGSSLKIYNSDYTIVISFL